jgi:hypothetical protein
LTAIAAIPTMPTVTALTPSDTGAFRPAALLTSRTVTARPARLPVSFNPQGSSRDVDRFHVAQY